MQMQKKIGNEKARSDDPRSSKGDFYHPVQTETLYYHINRFLWLSVDRIPRIDVSSRNGCFDHGSSRSGDINPQMSLSLCLIKSISQSPLHRPDKIDFWGYALDSRDLLLLG